MFVSRDARVTSRKRSIEMRRYFLGTPRSIVARNGDYAQVEFNKLELRASRVVVKKVASYIDAAASRRRCFVKERNLPRLCYTRRVRLLRLRCQNKGNQFLNNKRNYKFQFTTIRLYPGESAHEAEMAGTCTLKIIIDRMDIDFFFVLSMNHLDDFSTVFLSPRFHVRA